ncbi:LysM peptidoglycan-binding domain-containing protein [Alteromonas sediminis]|uniref:LysM peptidoglycan-binding domain-containing protein n=1 Tax=Alteromonas sediminis TaxID=2259342 RepID=A0A3N5Y4N4_9ALTE|nr:LysM peptidoglycan-binding domain-containing protein [Alteromonas sediminis]RPJ65139.1 LysM peptidoglycan-binding domain-containing protein [Alteromonas sediminis]
MQVKGSVLGLSTLAIVTLSGCTSTMITPTSDDVDIVTTKVVTKGEQEDKQPDSTVEIVHPEEEVIVELPVEQVAPIEDVWERVAMQLSFDVPQQQRIDAQRNWYLKHPKYMQRVMRRGSPFIHYIVEQIEARNMPLEFALLPIVESAFDPFAYSHGRAAGLWQFVPGTGKRFGMKQTWWYDGRRDVIASTQGALDYLEYLYEFFDGNWLHALAAYNSGEGRVRRAVRANARAGKPTDFWSLNLPRETRAYVPKLLALADILKHKETYNFDWPAVDNAPVVAVVETGSQIDLALAAELAGMETDALHALNPGFNRWATDPNGPHQLLLPMGKASQFSQALAQVDRSERLNWVRHKVKSGDSLLKLAKKYHTTADVIRQVNQLDGNVIIAGKHLMVPVAAKDLDSYSLSNEARLAAKQNTPRARHKLTHEIQSGDTLWDISRKYKVNLSSLAKWNGMAPKDPLMPGKQLVVWTDTVNASTNPNAIMRKIVYKVRRGDSLSRIANRFGVKTNDIVKWNDLNASRYLQPGQTLTLHIDVTRSSS